jgi:hypothetical protein
MSTSEAVFLALVIAVAIGYAMREYGLFVATYRNPSPPFPYPPQRLWRRIKISAILLLEALLVALTLWAARAETRPLGTLLLGTATLLGLGWLAVAALSDLRETRRQYAHLKEKALLEARDAWLATSAARRVQARAGKTPDPE